MSIPGFTVDRMNKIEKLIDAHAEALMSAICAIADPAERIQAVNATIARHGELNADLASVTRESVQEMLQRNPNQAEVARQLGISRARVNQLANG